jgi:uncharacterized protein YjiS (DUF1127 family)
MTNAHRRHIPIDLAERILDCGSAIRLLGREDYIVRRHIFADVPHEPPSGWRHELFSRTTELLGLWRRHYLTRRHLRQLDRRGLADIDIDAIDQDREAGKPFWKL